MNSKITLFSLLISVFIAFCMADLSEPSESYTTENVCQKRVRARYEKAFKGCPDTQCRVLATTYWQSQYDGCPQGKLYTLCRAQSGGVFGSCRSVRQFTELSKERCEKESKKTYTRAPGESYSSADAHCLLGPQRNCHDALC